MTTNDIAATARAARKAGLTTVLQLSIAAELLRAGELTMIALANSIGTNLEAIAYAVAGMKTHNAADAIISRHALGFSIVSLTPEARSEFTAIQPATQILRPKKLSA